MNSDIQKPQKKKGFRILPDVELIKLAAECRKCKRLKLNGGQCGGREGVNLCLAFLN